MAWSHEAMSAIQAIRDDRLTSHLGDLSCRVLIEIACSLNTVLLAGDSDSRNREIEGHYGINGSCKRHLDWAENLSAVHTCGHYSAKCPNVVVRLAHLLAC